MKTTTMDVPIVASATPNSKIPTELTDLRQWCVWRNQNGTKLPKRPDGSAFRSNDARTFASFAEAQAASEKIGFVITEGDPYVGIDLDNCIDGAGELRDWAKPIVERLTPVSYGEVSPSGNGIKFITRGKKVAGSRCVHMISADKQQIEAYDKARFWTITGDVYGEAETIGDGQAAVDWICETFLSPTPPPPPAHHTFAGQPGQRNLVDADGQPFDATAYCNGEAGQVNDPLTEAETIGPIPAPPAGVGNLFGFESSAAAYAIPLAERAQKYAEAAEQAGEGGRNHAAFRLAGHLQALETDAGQRLPIGFVLELVQAWNARNPSPLCRNEIEAAVNSAAKNGTARAAKVRTDSRVSAINLTHQPAPADEVNDTAGSLPAFTSAADLISDNSELPPPIVDGLFRRSEIVNFIGASKEGKSWLIMGLLLSVAAGKEWLGRPVMQGRVALIDNELSAAVLASRFRVVAEKMGVSDDILRDRVDVLSLRGRLLGLGDLKGYCEPLRLRGVVMCGLDAFYRLVPQGMSENDNAAMTHLYNDLDDFASRANAAVVLNHHSSKGDQSVKAVTDVGSGAGAISRAADTHIVIRPHELESCSVMEARTRSFPPALPLTIQYQYPVWVDKSAIPAAVKTPTSQHALARQKQNASNDTEIMQVLTDGRPRPVSQIEEDVSFGRTAVNSSLSRLLASGSIEKKKRKSRKNGKVSLHYRAKKREAKADEKRDEKPAQHALSI